MSSLKDKYHVAINSVGYMLRGAPGSPAYTRSVIPSQVDRLAISDIAYSDFSGQGLFYIAQTDWSGGIKSETVWRDDAKYYYSTNLDAYSYQGEIRVEKEVELEKEFTDTVACGAVCSVDSVINSYVGTDQETNNVMIYAPNLSTGIWTAITTNNTFGSSPGGIGFIIGHKNKLFAGSIGNGNTKVVQSYNGTTWTDHSADILTAWTWTAISSSRSACELGGKLYIGVDDSSNEQCGIIETSDGGTTWTETLNFGRKGLIISMASFQAKLYYLLYQSSGSPIELRVYDPSASIDQLVEIFNNASTENHGMSDKLLKVFNGKLIITINQTNDNGSIYSFDGTDLIEIFSKDGKKVSIGREADVRLYEGCVNKGKNIYWSNLVYNGDEFFNYKKPLSGSNESLTPLFLDKDDNLIYKDTDSYYKIFNDKSTYKTTTASNYIVFNEMSPVVSIDKMLYSISLIFDKLVSGDEFKIEYSIDNRSTWITVGTISYTNDGAITKRELVIPGNIIFNKIWWKVSMANTGGSTTPVLLDLIMAYKPMPNYKNQWQMRLDMSDGVKLLNKQNDNRLGYDMSSELWNEKLTKERVKFQDIDYFECTLSVALTKTATSASINTTKKLPTKGRIRVLSGGVSEEMYYTSAKTNKILGLVRGARGTIARAYPSGITMDNAYEVYVEDISTNLNFTDENKTESIAQVLLIES